MVIHSLLMMPLDEVAQLLVLVSFGRADSEGEYEELNESHRHVMERPVVFGSPVKHSQRSAGPRPSAKNLS